MTQLFTGAGLGLTDRSLGQLGSFGPKGRAGLGQGGTSVYVNAANGNLVLRQTDGFLADFGVGQDVFQSYNSRGDGTWHFNTDTRLEFEGSSRLIINRTAEDGHVSRFHYDASQNAYLAEDGSTASLNSDGDHFIYREGGTQTASYYNAQGQLIKMADQDGHEWLFNYQNNHLVTITDNHSQQSIIWSFNQGLLRDVTFQSGGQVVHHLHYDYDASHRLNRISRDLGDNKTYWIAYDYAGDSNQINHIRQSDGASLQIEYDGLGRIRSLKEGASSITTYEYSNGKTIVTNSLGERWIYSYDDKARLTGIDGPEHYQVRYHYEGQHLETITQGNQHWHFIYNDAGDCIRMESPTGEVTSRSFDRDHRLLTETRYTVFDSNHHPIEPQTSHCVYDPKGHLRFEVTAEGVVTEHRYDSSGSRISSRCYLKGRLTAKTIWSLDELLNWQKAQNPQAISLIDYAYDVRGCLSKETHYTEIDAQGVGLVTPDTLTIYKRYDAANRLVEQSSLTDNGLSTTHYMYDGLGRLITTLDNQGNSYVMEYDDAHHRVLKTDPNGLQTVSIFDQNGLMISTQRLDSKRDYGTTHYDYDAEGRLIAETDVSGHARYFFYDALGRLQAGVSAQGNVTEYVYDADGHCIQTVQYQNHVAIKDASIRYAAIRPSSTPYDRISQNVYNNYQQLAYQINAEGAVIAYQYDPQGKVVLKTAYAQRLNPYPSSTITPIPDPEDRIVSYYYDAAGHLRGEINGEGAATEYCYDAEGHLLDTIHYSNRVKGTRSGDWDIDAVDCTDQWTNIHTRHLYNAAGMKIADIDAEGYLTEYVYNTRGLVTEKIAYTAQTDIDFNESTTLDNIRPTAHANDHHTSYRYNDLNQVIEETTSTGLVITRAYNAAGCLISQTRTDRQTHEARRQCYRYDALGRVIAQLDPVGAALLAQNATFSEEEIEVIWQQHGLRYGYDVAGHVIDKTNALNETTRYVYNDEGLLTYTLSPANRVIETRYNAFQQVETTIAYSAFYRGPQDASFEQLKRHMDALADPIFDEVTHYEYNTIGLLLSQRKGTAQTITTSYNAYGEVSESASGFDGRQDILTEYRYDRRGLLRHRVEDAGGINRALEWAYDAFGRVETEWDGRHGATSYRMNKRGEQLTLESPAHGKKTMTYDAFGRVLSVRENTTLIYRYDDEAHTLTLERVGASSTIVTQFNAFGDTLSVTDGKQQTTRYRYDPKGSVIQVDAPDGNTMVYAYDGEGQLSFQDDSGGHVRRYTYDFDGHVLTQIIDPEGLAIETRYTYDGLGRKLEVVDAGRCTRYSYDEQGNLLSIAQDPEGLLLLTTYHYNDQNQLIREIRHNPQGLDYVISYTRDHLGRCLSQTLDPEGLAITTTYAYDQNNNKICETDANQQSVHWVYDPNNRLRYRVDARGVVTEHRYDSQGNTLQTITYAQAIPQATTYDEATLKTLIQGMPNADQYQFFSYDQQSRLILSFDGLGYATQYTYDANDKLTVKMQFSTAYSLSDLKLGRFILPKSNLETRMIRFTYDACNRERFRVDSSGYVTESRYDAAGQLIQQCRYATALSLSNSDSSISNESIQAKLNVDIEHDVKTYYAYDKAGRVTHQASGSGAVIAYEYDAAGNRIVSHQYAISLRAEQLSDEHWFMALESSARDRISRFVYDAAGRECYRISPSGRMVERQYDAVGNIIAEIAHREPGPDPQAHRTAFKFDAIGRLLMQTDAAQQSTRYVYDKNNNVISKVDANHAEWRYRYNESRQLIETIAPMTTIKTYQNRIWHDETRTIMTRNEYDSFGNVVSVVKDVGGLNQTVLYTYDAQNRRLQTIYPDVAVNLHGKCEDVSQTLYETMRYNAFGEVVEQVDRNGHSRYFAYNVLGQQVFSINAEAALIAYDYDAFGNLHHKTSYAEPLVFNQNTSDYSIGNIEKNRRQSTQDRHEDYDHDLDHRLTQTQKDTVLTFNARTGNYQSLKPCTRLTYNAFGEVTQKSVQLSDVDWSITTNDYDRDGLKISTLDAEHYLTTYQYNAFGLLEEEIQYATRTAVPSAQDRKISFLYDPLGRLTQKTIHQVRFQQLTGHGSAYETVTRDLISAYRYDALGHLVSTTDPQGHTAYSYYNAAGQLTAKTGVAKKAGRSVTSYAYDAQGLLVETHQWANGANHASNESQLILNGASQADLIVHDIYDSSGHLKEQIDATGYLTHFSYDPNGNVVRSWAVVNQNNIMDKRYTYDRENRLIQTATMRADGHASTDDARYNAFGELIRRGLNGHDVTRIDYDNAGRVWRSNAQGYFQISLYDLADHVTQMLTSTNAFGAEFDYDGVDLSNEKYDSYINFNTDSSRYDLQRQNNEYDALGHLIRQSHDPGTTSVDRDQNIIRPQVSQTQDVDRWGNILKHTNARGFTTRYEYNALDTLSLQELPEVRVVDEHGVARNLNPILFYATDSLGRTIATTDANGHTVAHVVDAEGRVLQDIDALGFHRDKEYNLLGQMVQKTNERGAVTVYTYDKANRLLSVKTPTTQQLYEYDLAGQVTRQIDAQGVSHTYAYDELGHLIQHDKTTMKYDDAGHKIFERDANGNVSTWRYDDNGRLKQHTDLGGHQTDYTYNRNGLLLTEKSNTGKNLAYHYYSDGQLSAFEERARLEVVRYAYDTEGNVTEKMTSRVDDWALETDHYEYDALGRLLKVRRRSADDQTPGLPEPDRTLLSIDYDYDAVGNIRATKVAAHYAGYNAVSHTDYFRYDANNRMVINKGQLIQGEINITQTQGSASAYDAAGNIREVQSYEAGVLQYFSYHYNSDNLLEIARKNNHDVYTKHYTSGQLDAETLYDNNGNASQYNQYFYKNAQLYEQTTKDRSGVDVSKTRYEYDAAGNVNRLSTKGFAQGNTPGYTQTHQYSYALWDGYQQQVDALTLDVDGYATSYGQSTTRYDINGQLQDVSDSKSAQISKYYASAIDGVRARKNAEGQVSYLTIAGKTIGNLRLDHHKNQFLDVYGGFSSTGSSSNASAPGQGFIGSGEQQNKNASTVESVLPDSPQDNLGSYTLKPGDTLDSLAFQIYGDSSLWYLLADANGIADRNAHTGEKGSPLQAGQHLNIPQAATGQHHTNQTHKVLNGSDLTGNTSPTTSPLMSRTPVPSHKHHHNFWKTMAKITVVVISAVAMVMSAGALAALIGPGLSGLGAQGLIGLGLSTLGGATSLGVTQTLGVGFAAGFLSSVAGQSAANALNLQKGIDFNGALVTGLMTAATAGMGKLLNGSSVYKNLHNAIDDTPLNKVFSITNATEMMERDALSQGLNIAMNHHQRFDWLELGISTATAGIMGNTNIQAANNAINEKLGPASAFISSEIQAIATGSLTNTHFDAQQILTDNLGNALTASLFQANGSTHEEENAYCEIPEGTYERFHEEAMLRQTTTDDSAKAWKHWGDELMGYGEKLFGGWGIGKNSASSNIQSLELVAEHRVLEYDAGSKTSSINMNKVVQKNNFDLTDAKNGLKKVYDQYGADMSRVIEKMYRLETGHFNSEQYHLTGTPGMEAPLGAKSPYYGWGKDFFKEYPEYAPIGTVGLHDGRGLSRQGGNKQKIGLVQYVKFASVEAGMLHLAYRIQNVYHGNYAMWSSKNNKEIQQVYRDSLKNIRWDLTKQIAKESM